MRPTVENGIFTLPKAAANATITTSKMESPRMPYMRLRHSGRWIGGVWLGKTGLKDMSKNKKKKTNYAARES